MLSITHGGGRVLLKVIVGKRNGLESNISSNWTCGYVVGWVQLAVVKMKLRLRVKRKGIWLTENMSPIRVRFLFASKIFGGVSI